MLAGPALGLVSALFPQWTGEPLGFSALPQWWGTVLALTYLLQVVVSVAVDTRFEKRIARLLCWVIWYALVFWLLQTFTTVLGLPRALTRSNEMRGTWVSPDRGVR